jgi:hypothetical protein
MFFLTPDLEHPVFRRNGPINLLRTRSLGWRILARHIDIDHQISYTVLMCFGRIGHYVTVHIITVLNSSSHSLRFEHAAKSA